MARRSIISLAAIALVLGSMGSAEAQRRGIREIGGSGERQGFWASFGLAAGTESFRTDPEPDYSEGLTKAAFSLRVGGTVNPHFRLGAELTGWSDRHYDNVFNGDVTSYVGGLMLIGQAYPSRTAGFFLKGGVGLSRSGEDFEGISDDIREDGFAWTAGVGYEIRLSRSLFLSPYLDIFQHRSRIRNESGDLEPAFHDRVVSLGVSIGINKSR